MDSVSRELSSLSLCLETLRDDGGRSSSRYPQSLEGVLLGCEGLVGRVQGVLMSFLPSGTGTEKAEKGRWAVEGREEVRRLREGFVVYAGAVEVALDMVQVQEEGAGDVVGEEIGALRERVDWMEEREVEGSGRGAKALREFLDDAMAYVGSAGGAEGSSERDTHEQTPLSGEEISDATTTLGKGIAASPESEHAPHAAEIPVESTKAKTWPVITADMYQDLNIATRTRAPFGPSLFPSTSNEKSPERQGSAASAPEGSLEADQVPHRANSDELAPTISTTQRPAPLAIRRKPVASPVAEQGPPLERVEDSSQGDTETQKGTASTEATSAEVGNEHAFAVDKILTSAEPQEKEVVSPSSLEISEASDLPERAPTAEKEKIPVIFDYYASGLETVDGSGPPLPPRPSKLTSNIEVDEAAVAASGKARSKLALRRKDEIDNVLLVLVVGSSMEVKEYSGLFPTKPSVIGRRLTVPGYGYNRKTVGAVSNIKHVLDSGADVNAVVQDPTSPLFGQTALQIENANAKRPEVIGLLLRRGASARTPSEARTRYV